MKKIFIILVTFIFPFAIYASGEIEYNKCIKAIEEKKDTTAIKYCTMSVNKGNPFAMLVLGHLYVEGKNKDLNKSKQWYLKFASSRADGYQYGYARLGHIALEQGNKLKAIEWFTLCSKPPYKGCDDNLRKLNAHNK